MVLREWFKRVHWFQRSLRCFFLIAREFQKERRGVEKKLCRLRHLVLSCGENKFSIWGAVTACGSGLFSYREREVNVCDHLVADRNNLDLWKDCLWNMMWDWLLTVSCVYISGFLDDRGNSQWVTLLCWQAGGVMEILENSLGVLGSELGWKGPEWKHLTKSCDSVMLSNHCGTVKTSQVFFFFWGYPSPPPHKISLV